MNMLLLMVHILGIIILLTNLNVVYGYNDMFVDDIGLDILLSCMVFLISIVTTIGGVGGGGLLIPTYLLVGKFKLQHAIPLSVITIFGDTLLRCFYLFYKKHPMNTNRYLVDLSPLLILVPFDANTSFIGLILSKIFPNIVTIILIVLVLGATFFKSTNKALTSYLKETKYIEDQNSLELVMIDGIGEYFPKKDIEVNRVINVTGDTFKNHNLKALYLLLIIILISIFSITRALISKCSIFYFIHIILQFTVISFIGIKLSKYIINEYEKKKLENFAFLEGDIVWDLNNIFRFMIIASFTGFLSTYMGIGGGMLTTPIMIQVGMIPEVVVATSAVSTLFSSMITTINYVVEGKLIWSYGLWFSFVSASGSYIGLSMSDVILKKFKRQSVIIFFVSLILFTSIILLTYKSITSYDGSISITNYCT